MMVSLTEQMLDSKKQQATALSEHDQTYWANKCSKLDEQIDWLVYDLYGLTEDEIAIMVMLLNAAHSLREQAKEVRKTGKPNPFLSDIDEAVCSTLRAVCVAGFEYEGRTIRPAKAKAASNAPSSRGRRRSRRRQQGGSRQCPARRDRG